MFRKVCAVWLLVLVMMPFAPPLTTYDLVAIGHVRTAYAQPLSPFHRTAALTGTVMSSAVMLPPGAARVRMALALLRAQPLAAIARLVNPPLSALPESPLVDPDTVTVLRI
jgi:hypothetical protein